MKCFNGHPIQKRKLSAKWHQRLRWNRSCDNCQNKIGKKHVHWRCGDGCDYNLCDGCANVPVEVDDQACRFIPDPRAPIALQVKTQVPFTKSVEMKIVKPKATGTCESCKGSGFTVVKTKELPTVPQQANWLLEDGRHGWVRFTAAIAAKLEETWADGSGGVLQFVGGANIDFQTMCYVTGEGERRKVARVAGQPPGTSQRTKPCPECDGLGEIISNSLQPEDDLPCQICYGASKYGVSVECEHYFCEECIVRSLEGILSSGQFPAFCPMCRADVGKDVKVGKITRPVLTLLQKRGVFTKEFQFRFVTAMLREQAENPEDFFLCPAQCGNYLVAQEPSYVLVGSRPVLRLGRCACGANVCLRCHQKMPTPYGHDCSNDVEAEAMEGYALQRAHEELMDMLEDHAVMGKWCPGCNAFIQKNEGCDVMMCGTSAHGNLQHALRNGGCGVSFRWTTRQISTDRFIDLDGRHKDGRCVTARQKLELPEHPKCARPECNFFKTVDALLGGAQVQNGGGEYCCSNCAAGLAEHHAYCHQIRYACSGGPRPDNLFDPEHVVLYKYIEPINTRHVRITWASGQRPYDADAVGFHLQFLGDGNKTLTAKVMACNRKAWWHKGPTVLNFGSCGLVGDNWRIDSDFGMSTRLIGMKTDVGTDMGFTLHYSDDGVQWAACENDDRRESLERLKAALESAESSAEFARFQQLPSCLDSAPSWFDEIQQAYANAQHIDPNLEYHGEVAVKAQKILEQVTLACAVVVPCGMQARMLNINWQHVGHEYPLRLQGCCDSCNVGNIWGVGPFSDDSTLCKAVKFSGINRCGVFILRPIGHVAGLGDGIANGVRSTAYGPHHTNFELSQTEAMRRCTVSEFLPPPRAVEMPLPNPWLLGGGLGVWTSPGCATFYHPGTQAEYYSTSQGGWIQCTILSALPDGSVMLNVKPGYWMGRVEQAARLRALGVVVDQEELGHHTLGEQLEYYSATRNTWFQVVVAATQPDGAVQLNVFPGYWMGLEEQAAKLRERTAQLFVGANVLYYSQSQAQWFPTTISRLGPLGEVEIAIRRGQWIQPMDAAAKLRLIPG